MRAVITGTHLSPALAVAKLLKGSREILFVGRKYALEGDKALSLDYRTITREGFEFKNLLTGRLQRKWTRYTISSLLKIPIGFFQALWILINFRPNLIVSFGGYVSLPVTLAGFMLRVPIIVHEQTQGAGLANRIAALFARKILISWDSSKKFFPEKKTILVGNPVREEIFRVKGIGFRVKENLPTIYVTGGSLGSHTINVVIEGIIEKLLVDFIVIHQTGDARKYLDYERLRKLRNNLSSDLKQRYFLTKHLDSENIGWVLNKADLVIGRAGANTVSELLILGKPALLIPLPFSSGDEQVENALLLKRVGLGEILSQDRLTPQKLYFQIKKMLPRIKNYQINREVGRKLIKKDAAQKIREVILNEV